MLGRVFFPQDMMDARNMASREKGSLQVTSICVTTSTDLSFLRKKTKTHSSSVTQSHETLKARVGKLLSSFTMFVFVSRERGSLNSEPCPGFWGWP